MKKAWILVSIGVLILSSCSGLQTKNTIAKPEISKGEKCSITVSGIEFTKSINGARSSSVLGENKITIKSNAKLDNFNDPDGKLSNNTAPVLLTQIDNTKPFTFTAKVTAEFIDTYDAGTLYIYQNPKMWFKFAFERDERDKNRIVTVRTIETSDDNNHDIVNDESVLMKISSDTETIGFYYSTDGDQWQLVRLFKNNYQDELWIGLGAQSPIGNGTSASFEDCSLSQSSITDFRMGI